MISETRYKFDGVHILPVANVDCAVRFAPGRLMDGSTDELEQDKWQMKFDKIVLKTIQPKFCFWGVNSEQEVDLRYGSYSTSKRRKISDEGIAYDCLGFFNFEETLCISANQIYDYSLISYNKEKFYELDFIFGNRDENKRQFLDYIEQSGEFNFDDDKDWAKDALLKLVR